MSITPKYVIVDGDEHVVAARKELSNARKLAEETGNRVFNLETGEYEDGKAN